MAEIINSSRYDEIIEKLKGCVKNYEVALSGNRFTLRLANGDLINLTFEEGHVAHLLGVRTDTLKTAGIVNQRALSYEILKNLTTSKLTYLSIRHNNTSFNFNELFSDFIDTKIEAFNDNLNVRTDDIYCIVKYCSERTYTTGEEKENSDYFIVRFVNKKYYVLGIKRMGANYVPVTSRIFENRDDLSIFLDKVAKNQEITYPTALGIENYDSYYHKDCYVTVEDKLRFNKCLRDIAYKHKAIPSVSRDFIAIIEKSLNNRQKGLNSSAIIRDIVDNVKAGSFTSKEEILDMLDGSEIPSDIDELIDTCNNLVCSKSTVSEDVGDSYSSIQNENLSLKAELLTLKQQLIDANNRVSELENNVETLEAANNANYEKLKTLFDAYESVKEK